MIIGCGGAGKSTLSKALNQVTNIEIIHLDQYYWKAGWQEPKREEWLECVHELIARDSWIMDGNFSSTMELRIQRAQLILFLDYSTIQCLSGVIGRVYKYHGKSRSDLPQGCPEKWDWEFLHYIAMYRWKSRPKVMRYLNKVKSQKDIKLFKSRKECEQFVNQLSAKSNQNLFS